MDCLWSAELDRIEFNWTVNRIWLGRDEHFTSLKRAINDRDAQRTNYATLQLAAFRRCKTPTWHGSLMKDRCMSHTHLQRTVLCYDKG